MFFAGSLIVFWVFSFLNWNNLAQLREEKFCTRMHSMFSSFSLFFFSFLFQGDVFFIYRTYCYCLMMNFFGENITVLTLANVSAQYNLMLSIHKYDWRLYIGVWVCWCFRLLVEYYIGIPSQYTHITHTHELAIYTTHMLYTWSAIMNTFTRLSAILFFCRSLSVIFWLTSRTHGIRVSFAVHTYVCTTV